MNRAYTPTAMMKRAAQITGKTFKARDYVGAADALKAWRSESTVPVVHVPTNHHKPSCVSGRGEWSGSPSQKPPYNAWICDECGASIPCEDGPVIVICKSRYDRCNYCPLDAIRTLGKVMEYDTEGFESYDDALAAAKRDGSIPSNAQFKAVTDWSGRP
jgi:hypothetical protein